MRIGPKTWMIAPTKTITRDKDGAVALGPNLGWLTLVDMRGRDVIPIFTTEEKANDYIRATNEGGNATAVAIRNLGVLADMLDQLLNAEFAEALTIDPIKKTGDGREIR